MLASVSPAAASESSPVQETASDSSAAGLGGAGQTEGSSLPAAGSALAGVRPEYTASDYVDVSDGKYRMLKLTLSGSADSSEQAQTEYQTKLDTEIMKQLFNLYPVTGYPESLLSYMTGSLTETYRQYAQLYGMEFSAFLETYLKMDETTFQNEVIGMAKTSLTQELILKAIAEKEKITISDAEYQQGLTDYAKKYGFDSPDALLRSFDEPTVRISLLMDKTMEFLEKETKISDPAETETETEADTEAVRSLR